MGNTTRTKVLRFSLITQIPREPLIKERAGSLISGESNDIEPQIWTMYPIYK